MAIADRGKRAGIQMQVDGCDISPVAVRHARQQAERGHPGVLFLPTGCVDRSVAGGLRRPDVLALPASPGRSGRG